MLMSPPTHRVVYSSDEDEPEQPVWPPRRTRLESSVDDEDTKPQAPQRRKKARRRANPFIESEAGLDGDASEDESDGNDGLADFIVFDE